jgi:hypothetical protein
VLHGSCDPRRSYGLLFYILAYDCSFGLKPFLSKELTQRRAISRLSAGARLRSRRNLIGRHDKNDKGETSKTEGQGRLTHWQPMLWHWIADAGWTQLHVIKPTIRADVMPSWRIVAGGETSHNSRRLCIRLIPDLRFLPMCSDPHTSMLHRAHTTTTQWCECVAFIWRECNPSGSTTTTGQGMEHSGSTSANTEYHMHLRLKIYKYMSSLGYFPIVEKQDVRPRRVCRRTIS